MTTRSRFSAARMIRWTLAADIARGFSTRMWRLAESAARMWDSCRWFGEQITAAWSPGVRNTSSMSSRASGTPNRSANARALGKSVSQIARTSTDLSFLRVGRCATWAIAPPPMIPTRKRSLVLRLAVMRGPPSVETLQDRARIVRGEDALVILPGAGAAHGSPLAHADSVARARAVGREPDDPAAVTGHGQGERIAAQDLARDRPEHLADAGLVHQHVTPAEADGELPHTARRRAVRDPHVADLAHVHRDGGRAAARGQRRQRALERGPQGFAGPLLVPTEPGRQAA